MPRGGKREGTPGQSYSNRTDLNTAKTQPVKVAPSQQYGQATQQANAQKIVPLPNNQAMPTPGQPMQPTGPLPGDLPGLVGPSSRPNEPITHGAASGAGGGPEVLGMTGPLGQDVGSIIRSLYLRFPSDDLRDLLEVFDRQNGNI